MKENGLVICVGELLIDFFCTDIAVNLTKGKTFEKQAGGAPANVCAAISRLGGKAAFVGKVGNDPFGAFLKKTLDDERVDTTMLSLTDEAPTTLAFVSRQADGERDFIFNRGADNLVEYQELDLERIRKAKIVHFGSATALLDNPFQSAYLKLMDNAVQQGLFVSFDPNYRQALWASRIEEFVSLSRTCMAKADFVKVSEEELTIITGIDELEIAVRHLHELGVKLVAVTLGSKGTFISNGKEMKTVSSIKVNSIDSTGAGDAFIGAMLYQLSQAEDLHPLMDNLTALTEMTHFSNIVGAIVCTKIGAISSLPTLEEVSKFQQ